MQELVRHQTVLVDYSPKGHKELDMTEQLSTHSQDVVIQVSCSSSARMAFYSELKNKTHREQLQYFLYENFLEKYRILYLVIILHSQSRWLSLIGVPLQIF